MSSSRVATLLRRSPFNRSMGPHTATAAMSTAQSAPPKSGAGKGKVEVATFAMG